MVSWQHPFDSCVSGDGYVPDGVAVYSTSRYCIVTIMVTIRHAKAEGIRPRK